MIHNYRYLSINRLIDFTSVPGLPTPRTRNSGVLLRPQLGWLPFARLFPSLVRPLLTRPGMK